MADPPLTVRTLSADEFDAFQGVDDAAFLADPHPELDQRRRGLFEPDRTHGAFGDAELIGTAAVSSRTMTLPGVGPQPIAAVTAVAVAPGHRRRGVLTALMRAQLRTLHESGDEPIAALWASEGAIYGRFGYGVAARNGRLAVPSREPFRPGLVTAEERVRELPREDALPLLSKVYDEAAAHRVGWLTRSSANWDGQLADEEHVRDGYSRYRFAVHPEAYAVYRARSGWGDRGPEGALRVREVVATSPAGYAAMWRYLLDVDLVTAVNWRVAAEDEPLVHLLANPRAALLGVSDSLWVRPVDLPRALALRRYAAPADVVFEVADGFCPWNAGRWRLVVDAEGRAEVSRTAEAPHLVLDVADLGAAYLGGTRLSTLAAAGRVAERVPGALAAASRAFAEDRPPHCPEIF
jgi:predicted acetyltransferase